MKRFIEQYGGENFDIAIIGGGITGAAVAYDAARRGFSVALLEKGDFGAATSSATSKLIHGGLRYLANGEVALVRESLRERRIMENIAPNLVHPLPSLIATYAGQGLMNSRQVMRAGMILYDILSFDKGRTRDAAKRLPNHRSMSRKEVLAAEGSVRPAQLNGGFVYYDCLSSFPERLTLAFIKSAAHHGARVANYARVDDFMVEGKSVRGLVITDELTGAGLKVTASLVINCAGPWADILLAKALHRETARQITRSEGIHIITDKTVNSHMVGLRTTRGRHIFFVPWRGHTLIGTTDKEYTGTPDGYRVSRQSIVELIDEVNESFGSGTLGYGDVRHAYGGLRPLVETQTEGTYSSSRRYEIYDNAADGLEGLITVEGGKYTTSRNLAEKVMAEVRKKSGRKMMQCTTAAGFLKGCEIADMEAFASALRSEQVLAPQTMTYLGMAYGSDFRQVCGIAKDDAALGRPLNDDGEILAQVAYAARHEMARTLPDIMLRRTGLGTLGHPGNDIIKKAAETAASELKWDSAKTEAEIKKVSALLTLPVQ
ncbi:MAG: glycerol-3-phosphate dehydrogenase/oxidase [Spirochaetes bacterium]|nr:glycerol-3-phosphate dehydrogenase/oxidase [Spirochaetota bacterium]